MKMGRLIKIEVCIMAVFSLLSIFISKGYTSWVWRTKTGRWENTQHKVYDNDEKQFQYAKEAYEANDYKRAIGAFRRFLCFYPRSDLAPKAEYYIALSYEGMRKHYQAYTVYQSILKKYPHSALIEEIVAKEYRIGSLFYSLGRMDKAIEIFNSVIENSPYGPKADIAQYKLGLAYKKIGELESARVEFETLIEEHPQSPLIEEARYEVVFCLSKLSLRSDYDQKITDEAIEHAKGFIRDYPSIEETAEVKQILGRLKEKKAKHLFTIARFYERQGEDKSALVYYEEISDNYKGSSWAEKAMERMAIIKERG